MNKFWNWSRDDGGGRVLRLEGPIDNESFWGTEITPQDFRDELEAEEGDVTVWINSPGGNVFAAAEIYTMLKEYKGAVTVKIASIAASAASVIAMAGCGCSSCHARKRHHQSAQSGSRPMCRWPNPGK